MLLCRRSWLFSITGSWSGSLLPPLLFLELIGYGAWGNGFSFHSNASSEAQLCLFQPAVLIGGIILGELSVSKVTEGLTTARLQHNPQLKHLNEERGGDFTVHCTYDTMSVKFTVKAKWVPFLHQFYIPPSVVSSHLGWR